MELKTYSRARSAKEAATKAAGQLPDGIFECEVRGEEMPTEKGRFFGVVVLDHSPEEVDLTALNSLEGFKVEFNLSAAQMTEAAAAKKLAEDEAYERENGAKPAPTGDKPKSDRAVKEWSSIKGAVKKVHAIADSMPGAERKDVLAACVAEGIALNTAKTQYSIWKRAPKSTSGEEITEES